MLLLLHLVAIDAMQEQIDVRSGSGSGLECAVFVSVFFVLISVT